MDIEAQLRDIISDRQPYLYEVLHENGDIRSWRGPLKEEKLWTPRNVNSASTIKSVIKTNKNLIDEKSIYTINNSTLLATPRQKMKRRANKSDPKRFFPSNVEQRKEKEYIMRHLREGQPSNMSKALMKHYFQAPKVPSLGYGMPRPETKAESVRKCQVRGKAPGIVVISHHRSLCGQPKQCERHCGTNGEYCDILGPGTCSACIEETNRFIADEIQRKFFPRINLTQRCLVVPKLSRAMRQGHMNQVRKKRLSELELPQSHFDAVLKRKETPLSEESYRSKDSKSVALPILPRSSSSLSEYSD